MKRLHFLLGCLLLCFCCTHQAKAKDKVIEQPPFIVSNTTSIEIGKVVISDTATVLHVYARYRPKSWIKIASGSYLKDNNGNTYQLRSGIGITPDKEFWMPESGEAEFKLIFPTLPASATSIDFTEGEGIENGFNIWGIQLKGKKLPELVLPKEAMVHKTDKKSDLPEPVINYGKATLKGKLLDFCPNMSKHMTMLLWESAKGDLTEIQIDVQADGSFSKEVPLASTTPGYLYMPGSSAIVYFLEPGQTTELFINLRELSRQQSKYHSKAKPYGEKVYINGPLAVVAQELNGKKDYVNLQEKLRKHSKEFADGDINKYKSRVLQLSEETQAEIDKLSLSLATQQFHRLRNELLTISALNDAPSALTSAAAEEKIITRNEARKYFQGISEKIPADYISDADFAVLNNPKAIYCNQYINLIIRVSRKSEIFAQAWGTDKGIFFDIASVIPIYQGIKNFTLISDGQQALVNTLPAAYGEMLAAANKELMAKIEENKSKTGFTIHEAGEVSNEDLFASIISKFKGKVILVDFWATWCGPCRMANKAMAPMKMELADRNIVYLYITGETSPLKTWENMIPDIHGEHYRLTADQWDYLGKSFDISGVPTYLVLDREGNTKYRQVGFPGVNKMKEELLKATEE